MSKAGKIIAYAVLALCVIVFAVAAYFLVDTLIEYGKADDFYDDLGGETTLPRDPEEEAYVAERMRFFDDLRAQYPAMVGYIHIPSVSISYPVMQGDDNEYYTTHLASGEESPSGSIFLDHRNATSPSVAENSVLYGHSMNNKTMFYNVRSLFDEDIFDNAEVEYICEDGVYIFESFSVYVTTTADPYFLTYFADDAAWLDFCAERLERSRFVNVETYDADTRLITLVTCTNSIADPEERYVYHGILKKFYERTSAE